MADEYAVLIRPLSAADGGGYEAIVPDLPGCMSDGESMHEAAQNVEGAIESWKEAAEEQGRQVPKPGSTVGQWRQRVPKSLHLELKQVAEAEGVSLNSLVAAYLAESIGRRHSTSASPPQPQASAPRAAKALGAGPSKSQEHHG